MIYFVDFENTGIAGLAGAERLARNDTIILFISEHTPEKMFSRGLPERKQEFLLSMSVRPPRTLWISA